jgi:tRNA/rRNA methyltransferase
MAGTDTSLKSEKPLPLAPVIILVEPQLGENIGMCARAMLNCAVTELRIVNPRDGWPNEAAIRSSSGATELLEKAKLYATTKEAIADLEFVLATTARERGMTKEIYTPETAAKEIRRRNVGDKQICGILFGRERTGLENDEVAMANAILNIPLNPGFSSLNLAQAVLLTCFSWLNAENPFQLIVNPGEDGHTLPANKEEIEGFLVQLESGLEESGFFRSPDQRPTLMRNIRNFFFRSSPTQQDVRTLHGIVASLIGKRRRTPKG